jgi:hypothetical protein
LTQDQAHDRGADPGVPEALPRTLTELRARVDPVTMDRLWIFPPLRRGRRERGLVAVSVFLEGEDRRSLLTASYSGERSGLDLTVESSFTREGDAPPDFLPRIMEGVVRRAGAGLGEPTQVEIDRDPERFQALLVEYGVDPAEAGPS